MGKLKPIRSNRQRRRRPNFPIQPASKENAAGRQAIIDSVRSVFGQDLEVDRPTAEGPRKSAGVAEEKAPEFPRDLEDAANEGRPRKFLELQLPAWALQFRRSFGSSPFKDKAHASLFVKAVLRRMPAEEAIAIDRRGPALGRRRHPQGDEARRSAQDGLFEPLDAESSARIELQVTDFGRAYDDARASALAYHEARSLFEQVAAELPFLGHWAILDADPKPADLGKLPKPLDDILKAADRLGRAMAKPGDADGLREARAGAEEAHKALREAYRKRCQAADGRWRDIDDVLVTPLIPSEDRQRLVERVVDPNLDGPAPSSVASAEASSKPSVDPGFRRRSAGLALLDYRLRGLAAGSTEKLPPPLGEALNGIARTRDPKDGSANDPTLAAFTAYTGQVGALRKDLGAGPRDDLAEPEMAAMLAQADQDARVRWAAEQPSDDAPSSNLEAHARRATLLFHVDRLVLDNAKDVPSLWQVASEIKLPGKSASLARPTPPAVLEPDVPPGALTIDRDLHRVDFPVGLNVVGRRAGGTPKLPDRAFVGVVPVAVPGKEPAPLSVSLLGPSDKPVGDGSRRGGLLPLAADGAGNDGPALKFRATQTANVISDDPNVRVAIKAFFRGQVSDDPWARTSSPSAWSSSATR